jgi:soluble P-type ATPase
MKAVLVFIDGTICDRSSQLHLMGTPAFYERAAILEGLPVAGSVLCLQELNNIYKLIYIGARPASALHFTQEWLENMGFPRGPVYLASSQEERLTIVKDLRSKIDFVAGIGDRWDDNELHLEIGCLSIIVKEHAGNWDTVRKYLLGKGRH